MRLRTIWDPTFNYALKERIKRTGEYAVSAIAFRMPKRLAYWVVIHAGARHIASWEAVPDVTYTDILQRMGTGERA